MEWRSADWRTAGAHCRWNPGACRRQDCASGKGNANGSGPSSGDAAAAGPGNHHWPAGDCANAGVVAARPCRRLSRR